jgi:cobalt-zinc-cadmium efflux system membrane fusion protein
MRFTSKTVLMVAAVVIAAAVVSADIYLAKNSQGSPTPSTQTNAAQGAVGGNSPSVQSVTLGDAQLKSVKVEPVGLHLFTIEREAVGNIAFNDDRSVQVYPPDAGKVIELFHDLGDDVAKGEKLYTIRSPDLIAAESTLIAAAGVLDLDNKVLERARKLYETQGVAQKELQQAISDQQTAEGALKAARHAVSIFGKTEAEIDRMVAERRIDPVMVVPSPITGRVTVRSGAPGLLAQPGSPPAPFTVVDISTMWMVANVIETDSPFFRVGQDVKVKLEAFPGRLFEGKISTVGANLDPNTHRLMVRSVIRDPRHELRPGMLATFVISTAGPVRGLAVPESAVVREGDGTMTAWVKSDRNRFTQRPLKLGLQADGWHQVLEGLQPGETIVTEGGVFLSNMLNAPAAD